MYSVGEVVIYSTQGVCRVKEISTMKFGSTKGEYYILTPVSDSRSVVYVPTANPALVAKMRPILCRQELDSLMADISGEHQEWISDDSQRKDYCDRVIKGGDRREIMRLMEMLYLRREALKDQKKHFHNVDAQYLKTAERMLFDEIAYVTGISLEEVPDYISSHLIK